jgi:hypothetical protein
VRSIFALALVLGALAVGGARSQEAAKVAAQPPGGAAGAPADDPAAGDPEADGGEMPEDPGADAAADADASAEDKALDDAEAKLKARAERLKQLDPFEYHLSRIAPSDTIPFLKPHHWGTLVLEMKSNLADYEGQILSEEVSLQGMPYTIQYRRTATLPKRQDRRLPMQILVPNIKGNAMLGIELGRPDGLRYDLSGTATIRRLEPHQMLILPLTATPDRYARWNGLQALKPISGKEDPTTIDRQRYYRLVIPQPKEKWGDLLSDHPLTWTSISHVVWDGLPPGDLGVGQQQAMLDWLHFGGQLVIVAAAGGPSIQPLQDSFLGPILPATPTGANLKVTSEELSELSRRYRPPRWPDGRNLAQTNASNTEEENLRIEFENRDMELKWRSDDTDRYYRPMPIELPEDKPLQLTGLQPAEGARVVHLGDPSRPIAVERRVGRGRVTMLAFDPNAPGLVRWRGLDTLVRRLVLRRPEEAPLGNQSYQFLGGPQLTWLGYLARDLGAPADSNPALSFNARGGSDGEGGAMYSSWNQTDVPDEDLLAIRRESVAAWLDGAELPSAGRKMLSEASGITIPGRGFVAAVLGAYVLVLVPVNYLFCRFALRRREWAWVLAPLLALGFSIGIERAAAVDLGFDTRCDEISLLEVEAGYGRGHLTRFGAICSTGRSTYEISYPNEPTALALPMDTGQVVRGSAVRQATFQSTPEPALQGFSVEPRSLAMFRAEQMQPLGGTIAAVAGPNEGDWTVTNGTKLEIQGAVLVDVDGRAVAELGTLGPDGAEVKVEGGKFAELADDAKVVEAAWEAASEGMRADPAPIPGPFLERLKRYRTPRIEERGELRLVGWIPWEKSHFPGQVLTPEVDEKRGFTLVVAHVIPGAFPDGDDPDYDMFAAEGRGEGGR